MKEKFIEEYKLTKNDKGCIVLKMFAPGMVVDGNTGHVVQEPKVVRYDPATFARIQSSLAGYMVFQVIQVPQGANVSLPPEVIHPLAKDDTNLIPAKFRAKVEKKKAAAE